MKILHVGDSFPDARVEKTIISDEKQGHKVSLILSTLGPNIFDHKDELPIYHLNMSRANNLGFNRNKVTQEFKEIVNEIDPDIIHCHNIFNAVLCLDIDVPWIYNDHEAWGKQIEYRWPTNPLYSPIFYRRFLTWLIKVRMIKRLPCPKR